MQTFDGVLEGFVRQGLVQREDATAYATNPGNFLLRLSDLGSGSVGAMPPPSGGGGGSMLDMLE